MANSVEEALNRASADQRERAQQTIEEARRNIQMTSVQAGDISSMDAANVTRQAQVIEEAKRTIPLETMKDIDAISPPLNTPPTHGYSNSNVIELHPNTQSTIENIEQGDGNNYLNQNAVDRAMERPPQQINIAEQQQQRAVGR